MQFKDISRRVRREVRGEDSLRRGRMRVRADVWKVHDEHQGREGLQGNASAATFSVRSTIIIAIYLSNLPSSYPPPLPASPTCRQWCIASLQTHLQSADCRLEGSRVRNTGLRMRRRYR
jgi:hypothetical protein